MSDDSPPMQAHAGHGDPLIPTTVRGEQILYNNNKAAIPGLLHEFGAWIERTGRFSDFVKCRGVLSKTALAVEHPAAVIFVRYPQGDPRGPYNPSPPIVDRLAAVNSARVAAGRSALVAPTTIPPPENSFLIVNPYLVAQENSRFLTSLVHIFGKGTG